MADVIHRTTLEQRFSIHTPDYDPGTWIINPDLSGVSGVPKKYWKIDGDNVVEMTQPEKDAVDAAELADAKVARKAWLKLRGDRFIDERYPSRRQSALAMFSEDTKVRPNRRYAAQPWVEWLIEVQNEVKAKVASVDPATSVAEVEAIVLDEATLIGSDPGTDLDTVLDVSDDTTLETFLDANVAVTDPATGISGPFYLMQILLHRRTLYGDNENPLDDGTVGLTSALSKGGFIDQRMKRASYKRPTDLLIYYGYPNSFNSGTNGWNNEKVAQDMAKYGLIVLGDGVQDPSHPDYANTSVIIPRIKALNPNALIFGYVATDNTLGDFQTKTDQWETLQVHGILMDRAGYDYGINRADFNTRVDYVHSKTYAKLAFPNAWNTDHILGTANDPSYPNSTWNSAEVESNLTSNDWILLESFPINTTAFSGNDGYESVTEWAARGVKFQGLRATYNVNFAAVGIIDNGNASGGDLFDFGFVSALMWSLEGFGTSDTGYAASSAQVDYWTRPDVFGMGAIWNLNASVQQDVDDSDVYHRYAETAKMTLDFSASAQTSSISKT